MRLILVFTYTLFLVANIKAQQIHLHELKTGDLIFFGTDGHDLSGAINRVTQRSSNFSFDHVGIIELKNDSIFIIHASSKKGSVREDFTAFPSDKAKQLALFRIKEDYRAAIPQAIETAKNMLGKPYNWSYVLTDNSYYCSDFIERIFRSAQLFELEPMTFVNPKTGKTDEYWIQFYQKLDMEVPEGKPGCNPNGLAASNKIEFIGILQQ